MNAAFPLSNKLVTTSVLCTPVLLLEKMLLTLAKMALSIGYLALVESSKVIMLLSAPPFYFIHGK